MSTTTMHFGPEWMRPKHQAIPRAQQQPPSPPPMHPSPSGASTYSALVSSAPPPHVESHDEVHPFRYSKEELLKIYKEGGGKGGLGLEVERWEGVVREYGSDPVGLREMGEAEKKLFAGPLNSDIRRRQSTDYLSLSTANLGSDRSRLNHNSPSVGSPMRERFGNIKRRDSNADNTNPALPRKHSLSSLQAPVMSPREVGLPSPRTRVGYTPSFDGVLNGGDSWVARRRASEAAQKAGGTPNSTNRGGDSEDLSEKTGRIKEEIEEENIGNDLPQGPRSTAQDKSFIASNDYDNLQRAKEVDNITSGTGQLSLTTATSNTSDIVQSHSSIGPPPGLTDLGSVEWSYKDPTGTVQGPFRADLMQKWFDDGYFASDLPMKRTHLDATWSTVEQLLRRCDSDRIFLSPLHPIPPSLSLRNDSPLQYSANDQGLNGPYQPAPIRSLRTSALESYISTGSNHSESPSSSFGGGRFGDSSPEPNAFGSRGPNTQFYNGDPSGNGRGSGFQTTPEASSSFTGRRGIHMESPIDASLGLKPGTLGANTSARASSIDSFAFPGHFNSVQSPWGTSGGFGTGQEGIGSQNFTNAGLGINYGGLRSSQDPGADPSHTTAATYSTGPEHTIGGTDEKLYNQYPGFNLAPGAGHEPAFSHTSTPHFSIHSQQLHPHAPSLDSAYPQQTGFPAIQNTVAIHQSPWTDASEAGGRRTGPFDSPQPTSNNTVSQRIPAPAHTSPWEQTTFSIPDDATPWVVASHGTVDNAWGEIDDVTSPAADAPQTTTDEPDSPVEQIPPGTTSMQILQEVGPEPPHAEVTATPTLSTPAAPPPASGKSRKRSQSTQAAKQVVPVPQAETTSPQASAPKPAWQKEDDTKRAISLREIQEAEARKTEAKKTAERERERAARAATSTDKEDIPLFTTSWGLPTSQAGSRANSLPVKETVSSPTPASTTPVWIAAPKIPVAKKTMKEILEEEEKQKKMANSAPQTTAAATIAATLPRRLHPEFSPKPPPSSGGAWTTVGPSGKSAVASTAPLRPPGAPSMAPVASRASGSAPLRPVQPSIAKITATPLPRSEDMSPSHEFLNWLNGSLKGLHSSVNVEEIMNMLLSFPIDADATTREIISDLIYANSTTMDGRRFADEFASRRKTDAIAHIKNSGVSKGPAKPVSIADVVKAAPKPTQPEWGFKVVNKKKKGARM